MEPQKVYNEEGESLPINSDDLPHSYYIEQYGNMAKVLIHLGFIGLLRRYDDWMETSQLPDASEIDPYSRDFELVPELAGLGLESMGIIGSAGGAMSIINEEEKAIGLMHSGVGFVANASKKTIFISNGLISVTLDGNNVYTDGIIHAKGFVTTE